MPKCGNTYYFYAIRNSYASEIVAFIEYESTWGTTHIAYRNHAIGNYNTGQAIATIERLFTYACNRLAIVSWRNNNFGVVDTSSDSADLISVIAKQGIFKTLL